MGSRGKAASTPGKIDMRWRLLSHFECNLALGFKKTVCAMFGVSDPAASPLPEGEGAILHAGALQEQGPCSSGLQLPGLQGGSGGGGAGADLRREGERVLAMLSLPVSPSRCASSRNLIYPKIWMLSMWYKWLTFST